MKKMIVWVALVCLLCLLSSCGTKNSHPEEKNDDMVRRYCANYATEYEVLKSGENDAVHVSIEAPDFKVIIEQIMDEKEADNITTQDMENAVKANPDCTKEYVFWVNSEDNEEIEKRFLDEVSKDLIVEAIEGTAITEEWSTEE